VQVANNVAALESALAIAREEARSGFYIAQVERMRSKVEKAKGALAGAEQSLSDAESDLASEHERVSRVKADADRIAGLPPEARAAAELAKRDQEAAARSAWRENHQAQRATAKAKGN